ncbi:hypothetical protein SAMN05444412_108130 [Rhodonellum ikkaensis]|uniref:Uncharacterized protein n=1 Tax=Rhodonellum ikkaensis TaxID=336829 RepID=A0A1H3RIW7_9BACT|nr:hypothetical protein SAMN05444412_108130 [Rhodonellum ikkaensis]
MHKTGLICYQSEIYTVQLNIFVQGLLFQIFGREACLLQ